MLTKPWIYVIVAQDDYLCNDFGQFAIHIESYCVAMFGLDSQLSFITQLFLRYLSGNKTTEN